jgi:hypothetical protein
MHKHPTLFVRIVNDVEIVFFDTMAVNDKVTAFDINNLKWFKMQFFD